MNGLLNGICGCMIEWVLMLALVAAFVSAAVALVAASVPTSVALVSTVVALVALVVAVGRGKKRGLGPVVQVADRYAEEKDRCHHNCCDHDHPEDVLEEHPTVLQGLSC